MGILSSAKNILFGKKDPGSAGGYQELEPGLRGVVGTARNQQKDVMHFMQNDVGDFSKDSAEGAAKMLAGSSYQRGLKSFDQQARDQRGRASQLIAQRGLGNSAVGLNAMLNADRGIMKDRASFVTNKPLHDYGTLMDVRNQRMGYLNNYLTGLNNILRSPGAQGKYIDPRAGGARSGGLVSLGLGALGAYGSYKSGGNPAQGFQAGVGAGQMMGNMQLG